MDNDTFRNSRYTWIKTPLETLGITITDNAEVSFKYNFQEIILNLKVILNIRKQRKFSLKGKITVIAQIIYASTVVNTPNKAICEINNVIQNFIWDGTTTKISQKTLIQQIVKEGLKLCHYETKVKALKLSWIKRLSSEKDSTWRTLPKYFHKCENLSTFFNANHRLLSNTTIPSVYLEIHKIFMQHFKNKPENIIEILLKPLWLNKYICINNDLIYYKNYEKKGIIYLNTHGVVHWGYAPKWYTAPCSP